MAAAGSLTSIMRGTRGFVLPRAFCCFSVISQASSCTASAGSPVPMATGLPQVMVEPQVTTLSSRPKPFQTWYGCQPRARQARSFSAKANGSM